jgi:hypothetical protein
MSDISMISGPVHRPGDSGYETGRSGFNLAVTHHPELIVEAEGAADVSAAVRLAASDGQAVAVMCTGHGPTVPADGAVMINTRRMSRITVDPVHRRATIEAGARWQDVIRATTEYGLAPLNGSSPHVGAIGYTLGGGVGLLGRQFGYAADHVQWIDVVTADGELRHVTADSDPDLFWALRGAGTNFGVVTALEVDLFPVARLLGGGLYFGSESSAAVLRLYADWARGAPEEMASSVLLLDYPDDEAIPEPLRGRHVTEVRFAYSGAELADGRTWIEPFRQIGTPLLDTVRIMPYAEVGTIHHEPTDTPVPAFDQNMLLRDLDSRAAEILHEHAGPHAQAPFVTELRAFGGALARQPAIPNAIGSRNAGFSLFAATGDVADNPKRDALMAAMSPWGTGTSFPNFMGVEDARVERVRTAYSPADFSRLSELKAKYDPGNTFRINLNIPPSQSLQ